MVAEMKPVILNREQAEALAAGKLAALCRPATELLNPFDGCRLWVREAWRPEEPNRVAYRADGDKGAWHPSIHLKRRDARYGLRVRDWEVVRAGDIGDGIARACGYASLEAMRAAWDHYWGRRGLPWEQRLPLFVTHVEAFAIGKE